MGAFLILRCGVRERESGMRQSTFCFSVGGGPLSWMAPILFFFCGAGGRPLQLDGRILDSPVRRSRARIGNAPIHFFFFLGGGGPFQLDGRILDSPVRRSRARIGNAPIHFFVFSFGGGRDPLSWMAPIHFLFLWGGGGGDPFSWMGAFLILRCGVRERESGMRQSTSSFFSWGGGETPSVGWAHS